MATVRNYTALLSGVSLTGGATRTPVVVTYSFDTKVQDYLDDSGYSTAAIKSWQALTGQDQQLAVQAMNMISQVSGVEFVKVGAGKGDIRFGKVDFNHTSSAGSAGFAYYPGRTLSDTYAYASDIGADVFLNTRTSTGLHLLLHEIAHGLGLKHPFQGDKVLAADIDNTGNTVMSYTGQWQHKLGQLDIDALQHIYGNSSRPSGTLISYGYEDGIVSQTWGSASSKIVGTNLKDHIIAGSGSDLVAGFAGSDVLEGGGGNDRLFGGPGNDRLKPGTGNDHVFGGSYEGQIDGSDTVDYSDFGSAVRVWLEFSWEGNAWVAARATGTAVGTDMLYGISNAEGGNGADEISGNANRNFIYGNGNNDILYGRGGNDELFGNGGLDTLYGDSGNDKLFGGSNRDKLFGGDDKDWLDGGTAPDQLTGGGGRDDFIFRDGYGKDSVLDFEDNIDTIRLSRDLWSGTKSIAKVISQFCDIEDGNAVFDFGNGDILTIVGVTSPNALSNDILIV